MRAPAPVSIEQALTQTADFFSPRGRETILRENFYKHIFEVRRITNAAGMDGTVCDLGGGLGVNLLTLRLLGHRGRLILVDRFDEYDADNRMGSTTDATPLLVAHRIDYLQQDFWADAVLPLPDGVCDVTTCFDVVEHLPGHPLRQLRELRRLLRPAGMCMISGPNSVSLMKRLKLLAGRHPYTSLDAWLTTPFYDHFREYSRAEYEELLRRAGFEAIASRPSAAVSWTRARKRFHRRVVPALSPVRVALCAVAAVETAIPPLRHAIYAWGRRPSAPRTHG
jgi:SAM-dependent methyltransferase